LIVPAPTNSQRIDDLSKATSRLDERIETLRGDLDEVKKAIDGVRSQLHELDTRVARIEENLKHIRERLDKADPNERLARVEEGLKTAREKIDQRDSRRFEIVKIIISALIGGAVGASYQWLPKVIESLNSHRGSPTERP
jgi:chromosome segregation ATPase